MAEGVETVEAVVIRTWESDLANFPWLARKLPARAEAARLWQICHVGKASEKEIVALVSVEPKQAAVLAAFARRFPEYRGAITALLRWRREVLAAFRVLQAESRELGMDEAVGD